MGNYYDSFDCEITCEEVYEADFYDLLCYHEDTLSEEYGRKTV